MATIVDWPHFKADDDSEALHAAMKGLGTDEDTITAIITNRSNAQRQETKGTFAQMWGKELESALKSELGGHYEDVVLALFKKPFEYEASELHHAMQGAGTDEGCLIEILCTRTNEEIEKIKACYKKKYEKDLAKAIEGDTSGSFGKLMYSLCAAARAEDGDVDNCQVEDDANALLEAGEGQWGTDESRFNVILAQRSFDQLAAIFEKYEEISEKTMEEAIKSEMSGDIQNAMLAIVEAVRSKEKYFARRLYKSMKGAGTDDRTLIRVMVTRAEVDLQDVKDKFEVEYEQSLEAFIEDDCSGDYKKCLLLLAMGNNM